MKQSNHLLGVPPRDRTQKPGGAATSIEVRPCYRQQVNAIAWRRAQHALQAEFDRQKQALTASLTEHLEAGHDGDEFFSNLKEQ